MVRRTLQFVGLIGLVSLASYSGLAAEEDAPISKAGPQSPAVDNRPPGRPAEIDGRRPFANGDNRRQPPPRGTGDARREDRRHPNPYSGRGPQDPSGPPRWSPGDTEWLRT